MRDSNSLPPQHTPPSLFGEGGPVGNFGGTDKWRTARAANKPQKNGVLAQIWTGQATDAKPVLSVLDVLNPEEAERRRLAALSPVPRAIHTILSLVK